VYDIHACLDDITGHVRYLSHFYIMFVSLSLTPDPCLELARADAVEARLDLSPFAFLAGRIFLAFLTPRPPPFRKSALIYKLYLDKRPVGLTRNPTTFLRLS
jgi:hypothetical protein